MRCLLLKCCIAGFVLAPDLGFAQSNKSSGIERILVEAEKAVSQVENVEKKITLLRAIAQYHAEENRSQKVKEIHNECYRLATSIEGGLTYPMFDFILELGFLKEAFLKVEGFPLTSEGHEDLYQRIIVAAVEQENHQLALEALKRMKDWFWKGNSACAFTRSLAKCGKLEEAMTKLLQLVRKTNQYQVYRGAIEGLIESGKYGTALRIARTYQESPYDTLLSIAETEFQKGNTNSAIKYFDQLMQYTILFEIEELTNPNALELMAMLGRLDEALALADKIPDAKKRATVIYKIFPMVVQKMGYEKALKLARSVPRIRINQINGLRSTPRDSMIYRVVLELASQNKFDQSLELNKEIGNENDREYLLKHIAHCLAVRNEHKRALKIIELLKDPYETKYFYGQLSELEAKKGNFTKAFRYLRKVEANLCWIGFDLCEIAKHQFRYGKRKEASETLNVAVLMALLKTSKEIFFTQPDEQFFPDLIGLFQTIAVTNAEFGDRASTKIMFRLCTLIAIHYNDTLYNQDSICRELSKVESETLGPKSALEHARKITNPKHRAYALLGVADAISGRQEKIIYVREE